VYLIFAVIDHLAFAPIASANNANYRGTVGKPNGEDTITNLVYAKKPLLNWAVSHICGDYPPGISEDTLGQIE
jgi:hypothetical protein